MNRTENESIVQRYIDALNAPTWEELKAAAAPLIADDIDFYEPSAAGVHQGIDIFWEVLKVNKDAFPDMIWKIEESFTSEDGVIIRWSSKGIHGGTYPLGGTLHIPPSHKTIELSGFATFTMRAQKIASFRGYPDRLGMMTQLGVVVLP